jgi:hypothetical protein
VPPAQASEPPPLPFAFTPIPGAEPDSYAADGATYPSVISFVDERRQRLYSRERDVGLRWRDGTAIYRAAWVEDTGELYLMQLGAPDEGGGHIELLAAGLEIEELEDALSGWKKAQGDGNHSLDWLRDRVRRLLAPKGTAIEPAAR